MERSKAHKICSNILRTYQLFIEDTLHALHRSMEEKCSFIRDSQAHHHDIVGLIWFDWVLNIQISFKVQNVKIELQNRQNVL